jgi:hypothetical protein
MSRGLVLAGVVLSLLPLPALSCSLCVNLRQAPTFRQEVNAPSARLILHGVLANPRLRNDVAGAGTTDFHIVEVLRADAAISPSQLKKKGDVLVLSAYIPVEDPKKPPHYLLICNVTAQGIDPYAPIPVASVRTIEYVKSVISMPGVDTIQALQFFFRHLDSPDPHVAADAFMEFVRASDEDIGAVGKTLRPDKLRKWLKDPATGEERLSLYAMLLGSCGTKEDVAWFEGVLTRPGERLASAYDGMLGGLIQLRPKEGWELAERILREGALPARLAAVRTLRFYMAWKPAEVRPFVFRCLAAMVSQGELADLAAENLRSWKMWELTDQVLALYGRPGLDAPIHRRAIVRYALCCPRPSARSFIETVRQREGDMVREVEADLRRFDNR